MLNVSVIRKCFAFAIIAVATPALAMAQSGALDLPMDSEPFAYKGDVVVTQAEIDAYLQRVPDEHRGGFLTNTERLGKMLDDMILVRLLAHEGMDNGVLEDPVVQGGLKQSSMVFLAEAYRKDYLQENLLDDYATPARELYMTQPELFETDPSYTFTHVLVRRGGNTGELDAMQKIFDVYEQLQEGAEFESLVAEYSEDPNASDNGGTYTGVKAEELDRDVAVAVQAMQPGQISQPVLGSAGWHIIRLDEKQPAETPSWEEAREQALVLAENRHRNRLAETLYRQLLESSELEIEPGAVEALMSRYDVSGEDLPSTDSVSERSQADTAGE